MGFVYFREKEEWKPSLVAMGGCYPLARPDLNQGGRWLKENQGQMVHAKVQGCWEFWKSKAPENLSRPRTPTEWRSEPFQDSAWPAAVPVWDLCQRELLAQTAVWESSKLGTSKNYRDAADASYYCFGHCSLDQISLTELLLPSIWIRRCISQDSPEKQNEWNVCV